MSRGGVDKMSTKDYINLLRRFRSEADQKESAASPPLSDSCPGFVPNPASTACSTGKGGSVGGGSDKPLEENSGVSPGDLWGMWEKLGKSDREKLDHPPLSLRHPEADPELDPEGSELFNNFFIRFTGEGWNHTKKINIANRASLSKQKEMKHG